jgi:hypothetical protein
MRTVGLLAARLGILLLLNVLLCLKPRPAEAAPCPNGVLPQSLLGLASNPIYSGFSAHSPYAAMVT